MKHMYALCVVFAFILATLADARACNCNNGRVIKSEPRCECECLDNFQLPDCDYKVNEMVRLDVYLNIKPEEFQSSKFLEAVEKGTLLESGTTLFRYANGLDAFGKTNVLIEMPGYGVRRFMPMVEEREVWVQKEKIESAYVIPLPAGLGKDSYFPTFDINGYTITAEGWAWLGAGMLFFIIFCCESCCCMTNDEEKAYDHPDPFGRREIAKGATYSPTSPIYTRTKNPVSPSSKSGKSSKRSVSPSASGKQQSTEPVSSPTTKKKKSRSPASRSKV